MATTGTTSRKPTARKAPTTRIERLTASTKPGAAWLLTWYVLVVWRDSTWPVAHTAITAVTAMAGSVI